MVTGNFALLPRLSPQVLPEWDLAGYADAYEWVELPNTTDDFVFLTGRFADRMKNFLHY